MTAWLDLDTFVTGNVLTKTQAELIRTNLEFLRTPPNYFYQRGFGDADYTITGTALALIDATNLATTVYTYGGKIKVSFKGCLSHSNSNGRLYLELLVDGAPLSNDTTYGIGLRAADVAGVPYSFSMSYTIEGLAEGNHTFSVQGATNVGTATIPVANVIQFEVSE